MMTNQEQFLSWCEEHGYEVEQIENNSFMLTIAGLLIKGSDKPLQINPLQSSNVLKVNFTEEGRWLGGSPIIWNTNLDWMKR